LPRLRFTREEAEAEATRLAIEFVAGLPGAASGRCTRTYPDSMAPTSRSSKHPVAWVVVFIFHPLEVRMDGGELFVTVDLETKAVAIRES
jgi:hypothetical protein